MTRLEKDFEFLKGIFEQFFKQKSIQNKLNEFEQLGITGWEIWLQIELMLFLSKLDEVAEIYREERCFMDKRKEKLKSLCAIDFIIRQKNAHSFIPLEIKQNERATQCIKNMIRDLEKYAKIRERELPSERELWCLGIHNKVSEDTIKKLIAEYNTNLYISTPIKNTNFMFTLF